MRFIDLYEAEAQEQKNKEKDIKYTPVNSYEDVFTTDKDNLGSFLARINHKDKALYIKLKEGDDENSFKKIIITNESGNITDEFKQFKQKILDTFGKNVVDRINNGLSSYKNQNKNYIERSFINMLKNDSFKLNDNGDVITNKDEIKAEWVDSWQAALEHDAKTESKTPGIVIFLSRIKRSKARGNFTIKNIGSKDLGENNTTCTIPFKASDRKRVSDEFKEFEKKFKETFPQWKEDTEKYEELIDRLCYDSDFIYNIFLKLIDNSALELNANGTIKDTKEIRQAQNNAYGKADDYRKLGQAMVFYSAKFMSRVANEETDIKDPEKLAYIMQGVFGEAAEKSERDSFLSDGNLLTKLGGIKAKMTIDAAKAVIASKNNNVNNREGYRSVGESYISPKFDFISYLNEVTEMIHLINEAEEDPFDPHDINMSRGTPASPGDFSNNPEQALAQAHLVRNAHPKEFNIMYDKLKAAFDEGVKEYQDELRKKDVVAKGVIKNPLTGKMERIQHSGFGTGGPNGWLRAHPKVEGLVNDIKKQDWNIFNAGPKLLFMLFDVIEKGGEILQDFCDDITKAWKGFKDLATKLDPDRIKAEIEALIKKEDMRNAMCQSIVYDILAAYSAYNYVANPQLKLYVTQHAISTMDANYEKVQEPAIKEAANKCIQIVNDNLDADIERYLKWKKTADIHNKKSGKADNKEKENQEANSNKQQENFIKKSFMHFLNEEDTQQSNTTTNDDNKQEENKTEETVQKDNKPQKIDVTIDIENAIANIRPDEYKIATEDFETLRDNLVAIFTSLNQNLDVRKESWLNQEINTNDVEQARNNANENTKFKLELNFLNEDDATAEESDEDDTSKNTNDDSKNKTNDNVEKIESIAKDDNRDGLNAMVEALKKLATPITYSEILELAKGLKDETKVDSYLKKFQERMHEIVNGFDACRNISALDTQLVDISDDKFFNEDKDFQDKCYKANIEIVSYKVKSDKKENPENKNAQDTINLTVDILNKLQTDLNELSNSISANFLKPMHDAVNSMLTAEKSENGEEISEITKKYRSFSETNDQKLDAAGASLIKSLKEFLNSLDNDESVKLMVAQYEKAVESAKTNLQPVPKAIYIINLINACKISLSTIIQQNIKSIESTDSELANKLQSIDDKISKNIKSKIDSNDKLDVVIKDITDNTNSALKWLIDVKDSEHINKDMIYNSLNALKVHAAKAALSFGRLLPANVYASCYWYIARAIANGDGKQLDTLIAKAKDELINSFNTMEKSTGSAALKIDSKNEPSSPIWAIRNLQNVTSDMPEKLQKLSKDCSYEIKMLIELPKSREHWDILAYFGCLVSVIEKIKASDLSDEELNMIYNGKKQGEQDPNGSEQKATMNKDTNGAINASYIPEFSPDMLINEIYNYITK